MFCISSVVVLVLWTITPLQGGIFTTRTVSRELPATAFTSNTLLPLPEQVEKLSVSFLNDAYGVTWLQQVLPAFTTREYAVSPLIAQSGVSKGTNNTWSYHTKLYGTDLPCHAASVTKNHTQSCLNFDDGEGCVAQGIVPAQDACPLNSAFSECFTALYVPFWNDSSTAAAFKDVSLSNARCSQKSSHEFLAIWKKTSLESKFNDSSAFTARFCSATYYSKQANATVSAPDGAVLINTGILMPTTNMVCFAYGASALPPQQYLNPRELDNAFQSAHRLLFALAVRMIMQTPSTASPPSPAIEHFFNGAVCLVPTLTFLVQGLLVAVVLLTLWFVVAYAKRSLPLQSDPSSIAFLSAFASRHPRLLSCLKPYDDASDELLKEQLDGRRLKLTQGMFDTVTYEIEVVGIDEKETTARFDSESISASLSTALKHDPWPFELTWSVGTIFVTALTGALVSIIILHENILKENGKLSVRSPYSTSFDWCQASKFLRKIQSSNRFSLAIFL